MSERAPISDVLPHGSEQARLAAELAKHEAQATKVRTELNGNTNFGKYDVTAPNVGEDTYESYMAKRPAEGIVRDGDGHRNAADGTSASAEAYDAQKQVVEADFNEGLAPSGYEGLGLAQLAKELVRLREISDKAGVEEVQALAEKTIMEQATRPDTSPVKSGQFVDGEYKKRSAEDVFKEDMDHFNAMVEKFGGAEDVVKGTSPDDGTAAATEGALSSTQNGGVETPDPDKDDGAKKPESSGATASHRGETAQFGEEEVTIGGEFTDSQSGRRVYEITLPDGTTRLVQEGDLAFAAAQEQEGSDDGTDAEASDAEAGGGGDGPKYPGQEVELYTGPRDEEKGPKGLRNKLKAWWGRNKEGIKEKFTPSYWAARWTNLNDRMVNRGVKEEMSDEDAEKKRNKNRRTMMIGTYALVAGGAFALGLLTHQALDHAGAANVAADPSLVPDTGAGGTGGGETAISGDATGEIPPPIVPEFVPDPNFSIPDGGGGEALFNRLGIDPQQWYNNEGTLLSSFPNEFYMMDSGHVGIASPGMLSEDAQNFINTLR